MSLSALVRTEFSDGTPQELAEYPTSGTADPYNFYRGALLFFDGSDHGLTNSPAADAIFAGVCEEQLVTNEFNSNAAVEGKLVRVLAYCRMKVFSSVCAKANLGAFVAATANSDDPADLVIWNPGTTSGCVGVLDQVTDEGVSGYVNTLRRISVTALPT